MPSNGAGDGRSPLPFARIALILAALVALGAVAVAVLRSRAVDAPEAATVAGAPASGQSAGDVASLIPQLEKKLQQNPTDPRGWKLLGLAYYSVGRYADAVAPYRKATGLDAKDPESWSALGEVLLLSGPGGVTPEAEAAFRKALALNPGDFRARYFMAVQKDASGDHKGAVDDLIGVLRDSPADAPWLGPVRDLLTRIATANKIDISGRVPEIPAEPVAPGGDSVATQGIPGPTATDLKAATAMTPSQQSDMAQTMVARLAARLESNPRDADGWIRLMRARVVLNDPAGARTALTRAKAAFQGDAAQQSRFDQAAQVLGVR